MGMASNEDNGTLVDLGLVDEVDDENRWRLNRKHFPSKVGGTPAWLNPSKLPPSTKLLCTRCNKPLIFLCQVLKCFL